MWVCVCVCVWVRVCVSIREYTYMHTYIHIQTHIHTYIHAYIPYIHMYHHYIRLHWIIFFFLNVVVFWQQCSNFKSEAKCVAIINFTSSCRAKKFKLYDVLKYSSDVLNNIYITYISVNSLSHLWSNFFLKTFMK